MDAQELIYKLLPTLTAIGSRMDGNTKWATSLLSQDIIRQMFAYVDQYPQQSDSANEEDWTCPVCNKDNKDFSYVKCRGCGTLLRR